MGALTQKYGESFSQQIVRHGKEARDHNINQLYAA